MVAGSLLSSQQIDGMPDTDVEKTLREIRERVRMQIRTQTPVHEAQSIEPTQVNRTEIESLKANLSVLQRSWNRLPPLTSYRHGWVADLELWCKRVLKRASHWFTWEQVNFNSATSNSLQEVLTVLSEHEEVLAELKERLEKIASTAAELQADLQAQSTNGGLKDDFRCEQALSDNLGTARITDGRNISSTEQPRIDREISSLARRIEELKAIKARLDMDF
ncbi:MAG TPA: hypothetical protein VI750_03450 [Pyrinomonadaceae bacterium]|nr:hypothetical protein [Pyrinomonadaceae bacterium]